MAISSYAALVFVFCAIMIGQLQRNLKKTEYIQDRANSESGQLTQIYTLHKDVVESLQEIGCKLEPSLAEAQPGERFQFERNGYFCVDSKDSTSENLVFNRTVALKDTWSKVQKKQG